MMKTDFKLTEQDYRYLFENASDAMWVHDMKGNFLDANKAFEKLPKGTVEELVKPENKEKLTAILTYHVVPGKVMAKDVVELDEAKTAQGSKVKISVKDGTVMVDGAKVIKTDIPCKNGVIHVIDAVILPKKD